MRPHEIITL